MAAATASATSGAGPLAWPEAPPAIFQGDGEEMVELLVDACVRAKEVHRATIEAQGKPQPRLGRELVPYFMPGSTDWGLEDVNTNTDDSDESESSLRGYESGSSMGSSQSRQQASSMDLATQMALAAAEKACSSSAAPSKPSKSSKRRNKKDKKGGAPTPAPPQPSATLSSGSKPTASFAGTTFGLASPMPDSLPMPTASLLMGRKSPPAPASPTTISTATANATAVLRSLLQVETTNQAATALAAEAHLKHMLQLAPQAVVV